VQSKDSENELKPSPQADSGGLVPSPRADQADASVKQPYRNIADNTQPEVTKRNEIILVSEDNEELRAVMRELLKDQGYTIIEASDGDDAIAKFISSEDMNRIKLLILDVIMPHKNGREVRDAIKKIQPDIKTIFISGYTEDVMREKGFLREESFFINKPFPPQVFLNTVREILDSGA